MLSHILAGGCFYFGFGPWVTKCEIRGLKTYKCVSSKVGRIVIRHTHIGGELALAKLQFGSSGTSRVGSGSNQCTRSPKLQITQEWAKVTAGGHVERLAPIARSLSRWMERNPDR
jgi:hypothetical protein